MMKHTIMPSLERIALLKTVSLLWNQNDIRTLISNCFSPTDDLDRNEEWKKIEEKILEKISHLQQPECLKEKLSGIVRPMGLEILKWKDSNFFDTDIVSYVPNEFFFTQLGGIDKFKTAELLVKDETLSIEKRYLYACVYCLEDYLPDLHDKLPEDSRHKFYIQDYQHLPVIYFTRAAKGKLPVIDVPIFSMTSYKECHYIHMFDRAIDEDNIVATEYFYKKLSPSNRKVFSLKEAVFLADTLFYCPQSIDILCFLLSQMNEEEQIRVFRKNSFKSLNDMLLVFLDWPWQVSFIETVTLMHRFISLPFYEDLLSKIVHKVIDGYKDCCYLEIFYDLCMLVPDEERHNVLHKVCASSSLLANLFKIKDKRNMALIFQDATPQLKKEFIVSPRGIRICCKLMPVGKWDLLEIFIQDCIATKKELADFKKYFQEHIWPGSNCSDDSWSKFFRLIDKLFCKYDKRKSKKDNSSKLVKRLCTHKFP